MSPTTALKTGCLRILKSEGFQVKTIPHSPCWFRQKGRRRALWEI